MKNILIDDIKAEKKIKETLEKRFDLRIFDAEEMTKDLMAWEGWKTFDPDYTIIVLPGNGASIVKKYINNLDESWLNCWPNKFYPRAKRIWEPGGNPRVCVEKIISNKMILNAKDVIIIDDVVSSGLTIKLIHEINSPWIPNAKWSAITWIMQKKIKKKSYLKVFAIKEVGTTSVRVPINSISTLLEVPRIAESYARRNFSKKSVAFLEILDALRQS